MPDKLIRNYRFKLKPTARQHDRLRAALEHCRELYNAALTERMDCYRKTGKGRSFMDQCRALTELRRTDADADQWATIMQRGALRDIDRAFKTFFKRGGFPRYKGRNSFKRISWPQKDGWTFNGRFAARGLGSIRVQQHRDIPSYPKAAHIKREGRHWYVILACEIEIEMADETKGSIGIDLGISNFAALSDGTLIPNLRHERRNERELRRRKRAVSRCKRGSVNRRKACERLSHSYRAIHRARRTRHFQIVSAIVRRFSFIAIENLNVEGLSRSALARDVNDAAWGQFISILLDKAESAGSRVVKVDPRGTSQTCPACGTVKAKKLSERVHHCACGFIADRDVAAAQVILHRAVHGPAADNVGGCAVRSPRKAAARCRCDWTPNRNSIRLPKERDNGTD